ncbi:response regulator transcription factor [Sinorhizobium medicae]|uniref:Nodulation protein W n=1 Tax=Sinorhizobium medicae TaxID=110321 RepID=A0A508X6J5_9HYPH|nr:response regulator [Sinorhizobium medicae]VTZ65475.1 Nodulation protein W [Sinorhizobium medicae]
MQSANKGTVFVVDDDDAVRDGIAQLLLSEDYEVRTFSSAAEFLGERKPRGPSCILLDVRLPGIDGMELQTRLKEEGRSVSIVFMTGYGTIPMSVQAIKDGASEFLTKPVDEEKLFKAVDEALAEDRARLCKNKDLEDLRSRLRQLTPRELEAMRYAIGGLMNKQLAGALGTSEITAKVHKRRVMEKMGARTIVQLVHFADVLGVEVIPYR